MAYNNEKKHSKARRVEIKDLSDKHIEAYFATFEDQTKADSYNEIIAPTAFNKFLSSKKWQEMVLDTNHQTNYGNYTGIVGVINEKPIVDSKGIIAKAVFLANKDGVLTAEAERVYNFIQVKASANIAPKMSFGYYGVKSQQLENGVTLLTEIKYVTEMSVLMGEYPANEFASVTAIKKANNKNTDSINFLTQKFELMLENSIKNEKRFESVLEYFENLKYKAIADEAMLNDDKQPHAVLRQIEKENEALKNSIPKAEELIKKYLNNNN